MEPILARTDTGCVERARAIAVGLLVAAASASVLAPAGPASSVAAPLAAADEVAPARSAPVGHPAPTALRVPALEPRPRLDRGPISRPHLLVRIPAAMPVTARPGGGRVVGTMPDGSRYYGQPIVAWVLEVSEDGRYGRVPIPYAGTDRTGWIRLRGLETRATRVEVRADLSEHRIEVLRGGRVLFRAPAATGAAVSPTPTGRFFVTDRVAFPAGGSLGTFAFGISGIQPRLPPGWTGGDQLAIHGTDAPGTIGTSASAGCLRVSERVLERLRPLLRPGTPVTIVP